MSYFDYIDGSLVDFAEAPEEPEVPRLSKSYSDGVSGYFARHAINARYKLCRESSLRWLRPDLPVVILGRLIGADAQDTQGVRAAVESALRTIPWCTYRSRFPALHRTEQGRIVETYTSDLGWGCTLRVGQMVLLYALSIHLQSPFDRNPFLFAAMVCESVDTADLAIHRLVDVGERHLGKKPGDWYAPSTIAHAIRILIGESGTFTDMKVVVTTDGGIFRDQAYAAISGIDASHYNCECSTLGLCPLCSSLQWKGSLLLFIPLMLGRKTLQSEYCEAVKFFLSLPWSVGIVGAIGHSAVYIVGFQGDVLMYLDPHYVQETPVDEDHLQTNIETFCCKSVGSLKLSSMGSSMTLAFLFQTQNDFDLFLQSIQDSRAVHKGIVFVKNTTPQYMREETVEDVVEID